ncbi:hypothetical protein VitviT2T_029644 [Vitis vinifera]|uniref:Uncharacterized protein n=2 Tax=Vitis vinifera TaxID=29760 RepID=A0ABY9DXQ3_VITVI|nr:hypothetical protein VitviT2T_029644 [Vitis vinifera]
MYIAGGSTSMHEGASGKVRKGGGHELKNNIANPVVQVLVQRHCTRLPGLPPAPPSIHPPYPIIGMSKPAATPYTGGKPPPYYPPFLCRKTIPHFV